ncbi:hypothetical protein [Nocardia tengchongensis]|uniref:hypothetical protein n=1 Tax=Nocardia tengchongensis TaxID=2055889 RepID=UPI003648F559
MTDTTTPRATDYLHDMHATLGDINENLCALVNATEAAPPAAGPTAAEVATRIRLALVTAATVGNNITHTDVRDAAIGRALLEVFAALADDLDPPR